ncbi:MAG: cobalamin B12-binding domain-containing protein [Chloroflexi bacterium]|nr:cobalamin B12-binding domain-containing protein [Chloroflexota bacterium]
MQYTVRAAARATGISESRLRTWERRYGVPAPPRSRTGRRLYEESDLAVIRRMAGFIEAGLSAAQAAEAARSDAADAISIAREQPTGDAHPAVAVLVASAVAYDERMAVGAIRAAFDEVGPAAAFERVVFPALFDIGRGWQRGELSIANEHFVSELIRRETLSAVAAIEDAPPAAPRVLLASPSGENHDLAIAALWLLLRDARIDVFCLGPNVPAPDLLGAVRVVDPDIVCLSATAPASVPTVAEVGRAFIAARVRARLFVGGPALHYTDAPSSEIPARQLPRSLSESADTLIAAAEDTRSRARSFAAERTANVRTAP